MRQKCCLFGVNALFFLDSLKQFIYMLSTIMVQGYSSVIQYFLVFLFLQDLYILQRYLWIVGLLLTNDVTFAQNTWLSDQTNIPPHFAITTSSRAKLPFTRVTMDMYARKIIKKLTTIRISIKETQKLEFAALQFHNRHVNRFHK